MMDVYLCVIKDSDVLLICKTGTKCTSYVKPLLIAWELKCQFETLIFAHSHKHKSNCKGALQCFLIRVSI